MRKFLAMLFPGGSRRRQYVAKLLRKAGILNTKITVQYYDYITSLQAAQLPLYPKSFKEDITFSIIVPAYNTPDKYLRPLVQSIQSQTYKNWQLVIVDASNDDQASARIAKLPATDDRIEVIKVENRGISVNTNAGIEHAKGRYVIFVDHDDLLDIQALNEVRGALLAHPEAGLLYSDEDKVSDNGKHFSAPHFKPDWSPDLMNCVNYITHLTVVKRSIIEQVGPLDPEKDGAQDYDFLLRVIDVKPQIVHIPKVLYHWREADNSTARSLDFKPKATEAGVAAVREHLVRSGVQNAVVENRKGRPGFYKVIYQPLAEIGLIITPFASKRIVKQYIERLVTRTTAKETHVKLLIPTGIRLDKSLKEYLDQLEIVRIAYDNELDFLKQALKQAGEHCIIINQLLLPESKHWLAEISGVISNQYIAAAAPVIVNDTNCVADSGLVYDGEDLVKIFRGMPFEDNPTFFGNTEWCRDVDGMTGAIALVRTADLVAYMREAKSKTISDVVRRFSIRASSQGKSVCIWSNVIFNDLTVVVARPSDSIQLPATGRFNSSLRTYGDNFHIQSDDETIINRLARIPVEDKSHE
jgi:O-antigen biosynthesis protein